ncbi:MFS transporter [Sinomonas flava]|uniref:MFS transporter n=1 Tax=Sinomonas flava TaxID=496857 RepID=UPI0039A74E38
MTTRTLSVQDAMDTTPMGARRWAVVAFCFVIALLDGFDTQSIAFIGTAIADEFKLSATDMTWVITASTVGMALGAMTLGTFGDRIGRKRTILLALAVFGAFSLAGAFATAAWQVVVLRFLIGLGMGGATPALLALTAEYSPRKRRGTLMTLVLLGLPGGAMIGGLVAAAWLPAVGWRGIFLIGGALPVVLLLGALAVLPESPAYLVAKGPDDALSRARTLITRATGQTIADGTVLTVEDAGEKRGSVAALFSPAYRTVTVAVWATYLFNWIAWFLLLLWMPTALKTLGLDAGTAALGTVTVNAAFIVFAIPLSAVLPRVNARTLLLGMFGAGILIALGLGAAGTQWGLVFTLIGLAGFGIGGQQLALNYLIANAYPTQLRATATGWGIGVGRLGSIVGSALGGVLLTGLGPSGYFAVLAVPLVVAALATLLVKPARAEASEGELEAVAAGH